MKSKKEISDLIRDNQHKLDERPNPRAWKKLEERLDQHEGKNKRPTRILMYRRLAMAAAVVAMIAMISIINTSSSSNDMVKAEANHSPQDQFAQGLEPVYSKEDNNLRQVIEFKRQLKDRYANPIQEGTQTKKLLASNNTSTKRNEALAINEKPTPKANIEAKENAGNISMEMNKNDIVEAEVIEEVSVTTDQIMADAAPPPSVLAAPTAKMSAKKERKKDSLSKSKPLPTGIKRLEWMIGDWSRNRKTLNILLLNNSDLVCSDFRIKEIGNELFYVDSNNSTFELINQSLNQFVFEHKNKDQVIIELLGKNKFSKTMIKSKSGEKLVEVFTK